MASAEKAGYISVVSNSNTSRSTASDHRRFNGGGGIEITALQTFPAAYSLAVGRADGSIQIWKYDSMPLQSQRVLTGHKSAIGKGLLAWTETGHLVSGSYDGAVRIWNVISGECLKKPSSAIAALLQQQTEQYWLALQQRAARNANPLYSEIQSLRQQMASLQQRLTELEQPQDKPTQVNPEARQWAANSLFPSRRM